MNSKPAIEISLAAKLASGFVDSFRLVDERLKKSAQEVQNLKNNIDRVKAFKELTDQTKDSKLALDQQRASLAKLRSEIEKKTCVSFKEQQALAQQEKGVAKLSKAYDEYKLKVKQSQSDISLQRSVLGNLKMDAKSRISKEAQSEISKQERQVNKLARAYKALEVQTKASKASMELEAPGSERSRKTKIYDDFRSKSAQSKAALNQGLARLDTMQKDKFASSAHANISQQENALAKLVKEHEALAVKANGSKSALELQKNSLSNLRAEISKHEKIGKKDRREIDKQERSVNELTEAYQKKESALSKLTGELKEAAVDTSNLSKENDRLNQSLSKVTGTYDKLQSSRHFRDKQRQYKDRASEARGDLFGAAAPLVAIGAALSRPLRFEHESQKAVVKNSMGQEEAKAYRDFLLKQAANFAATTVQTARVGNIYSTAGLSTDEIKGLTPATLATAEATGTSYEGVAQLISNFSNSFKLGKHQGEGALAKNQAETQYIADLVAYTANKSRATVEALTESSRYLLTKPKELGLGLNETLAYASLGAGEGLDGSRFGTSMLAFFERLSDPMKRQELAQEAGVATTETVNGKERILSPREIAQNIFNQNKDTLWSEEKQEYDFNNPKYLDVMKKTFETEAGYFLGALVKAQFSGDLDKRLGDYEKSTFLMGGAKHEIAQRYQKKMMDTSYGEMQQTGSKLDVAAVKSFSEENGLIKSTFQGINQLINGYSEFAESHKTLVSYVTRFTAGMLGVNLAMKAGKFLVWGMTSEILGAIRGVRVLSKWMKEFKSTQKLANLAKKASIVLDFASGKSSRFLAGAKALVNIQTYRSIAAKGAERLATIASTVATNGLTLAKKGLNLVIGASPIGRMVRLLMLAAGGALYLANKFYPLNDVLSSITDKADSMFSFLGGNISDKEMKITQKISPEVSKIPGLDNFKETPAQIQHFKNEIHIGKVQIVTKEGDPTVLAEKFKEKLASVLSEAPLTGPYLFDEFPI